jgi:Flp pilus assembly protein TadG
MMRNTKCRRRERGSTLVEFAIGATVFLMVMFAVIEFSRMLWVHNALADAARRGARYAVTHSSAEVGAVRNVVVYDNPAGGTKPVVDRLTTSNVKVDYSNFGLSGGSATVSITDYQFNFVFPVVSTSIQMPAYATTLTAESAGLIPPNL